MSFSFSFFFTSPQSSAASDPRSTTSSTNTSRSTSPAPSRSPISSSASSRPASPSPSCAYPSWPRRASLNLSAGALTHTSCEAEATSFISDDDLFEFASEDTTQHKTRAELASRHAVTDLCELGQVQVYPVGKVSRRRTRRGSMERRRRSSNASAKELTPIVE